MKFLVNTIPNDEFNPSNEFFEELIRRGWSSVGLGECDNNDLGFVIEQFPEHSRKRRTERQVGPNYRFDFTTMENLEFRSHPDIIEVAESLGVDNIAYIYKNFDHLNQCRFAIVDVDDDIPLDKLEISIDDCAGEFIREKYREFRPSVS